MKKLFLASAVALFGAVNAQEYKPTTGDITTEFGLTGGLGNTGITLPSGDAFFKARYFKSENIAYRASFLLGSKSDTKDIDNTAGSIVTTGKDKSSSTSFLVGFGLEKHFKGTDKLSPYVGAEALLGFGTKKTSTETTTTAPGVATINAKNTVKGANTFTFGVRGVFGADYYFTKRVFLGVEAGLSLGFASEGKTKTTTELTGVPTVTTETPGGRSFEINPSVVGGIRIGYAF